MFDKQPIFKSNFTEPVFKSTLDKTSSLKSRYLSSSQLFEILQEEYIVCELRSKIYPECIRNKKGEEVFPREYWKSLMEKKKVKIVDLAKRNGLFSIFDDKRVMMDFYKRIIPEVGFPKFIYKDDHQRLLQEKWDIHNYYNKGESVKVYEDGKFLTGIIKAIDFANNSISICIDEELKKFSIEVVTRIL